MYRAPSLVNSCCTSSSGELDWTVSGACCIGELRQSADQDTMNNGKPDPCSS